MMITKMARHCLNWRDTKSEGFDSSFFRVGSLKAVPIWEMATPMLYWDYENQNTVFLSGTGVLKTEWDFPCTGRSDMRMKQSCYFLFLFLRLRGY